METPNTEQRSEPHVNGLAGAMPTATPSAPAPPIPLTPDQQMRWQMAKMEERAAAAEYQAAATQRALLFHQIAVECEVDTKAYVRIAVVEPQSGLMAFVAGQGG